MTDNPTTIRRISAAEMCEMFNKGQYWEKVKSGELTAVTLEDRHPALTKANEPFCTRSQMVSYRTKADIEVARVHQYLRSDGSIGASKRPDPKRVFKEEEGILYRLHKKPSV